ncbi:MAG TPA: radical SAM family heme chaperone HemW [Chlamydiales bacterium]
MEARRSRRPRSRQLVDVSLYFHIPFCTKKCPYCHFYVIPNEKRFHALLLEGMKLEWELQKEKLRNKQIVSIYFGGGTPSLFGAQAIGEVLSWCRELSLSPDCEITLEANPEEATREQFLAFKAAGINRVSLGVQSLDDRALDTLGRTHSAEKAKQAICAAHAAGIENISIDLMYDLPDQTESSWRYTLDQLQNLPFTHLSLYNLTIEPHTAFSKRKLKLPAPESSLHFLHMALEKFATLGLERYEISAFSKPGFRSRHNLGYWHFRPFLGFGPSAFSYWESARFQNIPNLQRYLRALQEGKSPVHFHEKLDRDAQRKERLAVGLRCTEGCDAEGIPEETRAALESLCKQGLVAKEGTRARLTKKGMLFYDTVAAALI